MKHLIDTAEQDSGEVYAQFPIDTVLEKGEVIEVHKPSEHPECPECREYLKSHP